MAWEGSNRRARLPRDWHRIRAVVLARDGHRCRAVFSDGRRCGRPANQVDHVVPGDDHRLSNLQALCAWCHAQKSAREGAAARGPRPTTKRAAERHPGLIGP